MSRPFSWWHGLLVLEATAVLIALAMASGPQPTGIGRALPNLLFDDPGPATLFLVWFALTNALILLVGLGLWLWVRRTGENFRV